jgi:hypothetical protein
MTKVKVVVPLMATMRRVYHQADPGARWAYEQSVNR